MKDPFVAEIRKIRNKLNRLIEKHPEQFEARMQAIREQYKDRLVRLGPRRIKKVPA
jgi:hypothetical protein